MINFMKIFENKNFNLLIKDKHRSRVKQILAFNFSNILTFI